jgi:hypothetical protein
MPERQVAYLGYQPFDFKTVLQSCQNHGKVILCALFYYPDMNVVIVRICFITVFLLFFTLQSVASSIEVDVVNAHDQIHHELENGHDESKHDSSSDHSSDELHEAHHVHLCHHHHGEHAAKVFIQAPNLYSFFIDVDNAIGFLVHYDNIARKSLYRPPIS